MSCSVARRTAVVTAVALLAAGPAAAQLPTSVLEPGALFRVSGEATTWGELYAISGREPRRPDALGRLTFQPVLHFTRHVRIALDLQLATEGSGAGVGAIGPSLGAARQRLNQLGVSPEWAWGRVSVGDFTDTYTPLTYAGVRVRGAGTQLFPGLLRFGVFGGQAQSAVVGATPTASYTRSLAGGRIGVGREEGSFFDLVVVRALDDAGSLPPPDDTVFIDPRLDDPTVDPDTLPVGTLVNPLAVTPQENVVASASSRLVLFRRRLELRAELSGTAYSRDVRATPIDNEAVLAEVPGLLRDVFTPRVGSSYGAAYTATADLRLRTFSGYARILSIEPGYVALGVASLLNDQRAWELGGTQRLGRAGSLRLDVGRQRDNLFDQKEFTTYRDRYGAALALRPTRRWTASVRANYVTMDNHLPADDAQWVAYGSWVAATTHTFSLSRDRLLRSTGFTYTYRRTGDDNPARAASTLVAHSATARVVLAPAAGFSVTPSFGVVRTWPANAPGWMIRETYGIAGQLRVLDGRWTTSLALGSTDDGNAGSSQARLTSRYDLTALDALTFSLRGSQYRNAPNPFGAAGDFAELTVSLQLTHRFGNGP